jgi:hypothetical protein
LIDDNDRTVALDGHAGGLVQQRNGGGPTITEKAAFPGASDCRDSPAETWRRDFTNAIVTRISDQQVAGSID